jgi:hypothetical protein
MAAVLPVTSLYAGIHAAFYAILSLRVAMSRGQAMKEKKPAEQFEDFKHKSSVSSPGPGDLAKGCRLSCKGLTCDKDECKITNRTSRTRLVMQTTSLCI